MKLKDTFVFPNLIALIETEPAIHLASVPVKEDQLLATALLGNLTPVALNFCQRSITYCMLA